MDTDPSGHHYDAAEVERVCDAVHQVASDEVDMAQAFEVVVSVTRGDGALAHRALSACARRSLSQTDGWFHAARLLERALAAEAFDQKT